MQNLDIKHMQIENPLYVKIICTCLHYMSCKLHWITFEISKQAFYFHLFYSNIIYFCSLLLRLTIRNKWIPRKMIPLDSAINVTSKSNVAPDIMWYMNWELIHISQVSPRALISILNEEGYWFGRLASSQAYLYL